MREIEINQFLENIKKYVKITKKPFIIGIAGGSGSGKTFVANKIGAELSATIISMDDYIIGEKILKEDNWDLPEIWDIKTLKKHIVQLEQGKIIKKPCYDFAEHITKGYEEIKPEEIIIIEGLYALHDSIEKLIDLRIFVDASEKIRLTRRIERDTQERGRTKEEELRRWKKTVQPTYLQYIAPEKNNADIIIINN